MRSRPTRASKTFCGTLPLRNPGTFVLAARSEDACSTACFTWSLGTSTSRRTRFSASGSTFVLTRAILPALASLTAAAPLDRPNEAWAEARADRFRVSFVYRGRMAMWADFGFVHAWGLLHEALATRDDSGGPVHHVRDGLGRGVELRAVLRPLPDQVTRPTTRRLLAAREARRSASRPRAAARGPRRSAPRTS